MFIDVKIPWETDRKLGYAIDRAMSTVDDWVLILDHDVFLSLNPFWYKICQNAIDEVGNDAGWITCYTNSIGCPLQKIDRRKYLHNFDNNCMDNHFNLAKEIYKKNKGEILDITVESVRWKLSGLFILTRKEVYERVKLNFGMPGSKFIGWDNYYSDRLHEMNYKLYLMKDLYIYHGYKRLWKDAEWNQI